MAEPPLLAGADQRAMAVSLPPILPEVAVAMTGAPGADSRTRGVTGADAAEAAPVPIALTADTRNVYDVPFANPVTVVEVPAPDTETVRAKPPVTTCTE